MSFSFHCCNLHYITEVVTYSVVHSGRLVARRRHQQGKLPAQALLECGDSIRKTRQELKCQYFYQKSFDRLTRTVAIWVQL